MRRKNRLEIYKEAPSRGPYDECPMLELGIDPQLHLSRNAVPQPFFLVCEQDTVIAQMSGTARIEFRDSAVNYFDMALGDFAYIPGGTPHRIAPKAESIHLRYKASAPGLEAVAWYSDKTREELSRITWDCAAELPQEAYLRACRAFNADPKMRTCPTTGAVLPQIDLAPFRWAELAAEIKEAEAAERSRLDKKGGASRTAAPRAAGAIAAAPEDKVPLKVNVYDFARVATAALAPMFPYLEPGCIVPCVTLQDPGKRGAPGYFVHYNTVYEVNVCFGTSGSYQVPGGVQVGPYTHGVGVKPGQPANPAMINIGVITQRQSVGLPQKEAMIFMCEKCNAEVLRRDYDAHAYPDRFEKVPDPRMLGLPTIQQSSAAAEALNASEEARTSKSSGHVNQPFPTPYWGWDDYRRRTHVIVQARNMMTEAAANIAAQAAE